jgi:hypothetical protein
MHAEGEFKEVLLRLRGSKGVDPYNDCNDQVVQIGTLLTTGMTGIRCNNAYNDS